jgi:hypothetical protein
VLLRRFWRGGGGAGNKPSSWIRYFTREMMEVTWYNCRWWWRRSRYAGLSGTWLGDGGSGSYIASFAAIGGSPAGWFAGGGGGGY